MSTSQKTSPNSTHNSTQNEHVDPAAAPSKAEIHPILKSYLYGNNANALKWGFWWVAFSPLCYAVFHNESAIGWMRLAFNIPMIFILPLAGVLVERLSIRRVLLNTTWMRLVVYVIATPLIWILFGTNVLFGQSSKNMAALWALVATFQFIDGCAVAFGGVLDIDYGGTDLLADQYGISEHVNDIVRVHFNTNFEMATSLATIFIGPLAAGIGYAMTQVEFAKGSPGDNVADGVNIAVYAAVWLTTSLVSLVYYAQLPLWSKDKGISSPTSPALAETARAVFEDLKEGLRIIWNNRPIFWRLVFFSCEWALEDAMMAVLIFFMALKAEWMGNDNIIQTMNWTSGIIAVGKIGSLMMAAAMNKWWTPPGDQHRKSGYTWLFVFSFVSQACVLLLPLGFFLGEREMEPRNGNPTHSLAHVAWAPSDVLLARCVVLFGVFLFNALVTLPKLAFQTLLQSLVSDQDGSGKVYGLVGVFCTAASAAVPYLFTVLFERTEVQTALWISAGVYAAFGLFQAMFGPCLVLSEAETQAQESDRHEP